MKVKIYSLVLFLLFQPLFPLTESEEYECKAFYLSCINGEYSDIVNKLTNSLPAKNHMLLSYRHPQTNESPFVAVLSRNLPLIARVLLIAGSYVHEKNAAGFSPIHIAAMHGLTEIVTMLLQRKVPIDVQTTGTLQTALHLAVEHDHPETASMLIASGARLDICDTYQRLPFHYAVMTGNQQLTQKLLINKQNINKQDFDGKTAIHFALDASLDYLKWFLKTYKRYINFSIQDTSGNTPLHYAIYHTDIPAVVYLLLLNPPLATVNCRELTPLGLAEDLELDAIIEAIKLRESCK